MIRRKLSPFGVAVKKRLLDLGITQSAFCRQHGIPENRFSESLSSKSPINKYRDKIARILGIPSPGTE